MTLPVSAQPERLVRPYRPRARIAVAALTACATLLIGIDGAAAGPSGLPWRSGAACDHAEFARWRGRPLDVYLLFTPHRTWKGMLKHYRGSSYNQAGKSKGLASISMPMLPWESKGDFRQCAAGKFDGRFREFGQAIVAKGLGDAYIRLGWEAGNGSHPWHIGKQIDDYKQCWRRQARVLKSVSRRFKLEWTNARRGEQKWNILRAYPGDDVVDVIGTHNYDRYPNYPNEKAWDKYYNRKTQYGQPWGMGAWLKFARSRGKKLAISEWAVADGYGKSGSKDNAFYIKKMHELFRRNAKHIEYETYFNCTGGIGNGVYKIYPARFNPKAASAYRARWGR